MNRRIAIYKLVMDEEKSRRHQSVRVIVLYIKTGKYVIVMLVTILNEASAVGI